MGVLIMRIFGGVEKWSSRQAHNLKIVGSNPTSTKSKIVRTVLRGYSLKVKCWFVAPRDMGSTPVNPVRVFLGRMAEWFKASVLKTEGFDYLAGSNPVPLFATVAQLGRALVLHVGGYGFESRRLHFDYST